MQQLGAAADSEWLIKKELKKEQKKLGHPLSRQIIGEKDPGSVYIVNLQSLN